MEASYRLIQNTVYWPKETYRNIMVYAKSFVDVYVGETLVYVNSLDNLAVAIN